VQDADPQVKAESDDESVDLWASKTPSVITNKFSHTWTEEVKALPKWQEKRQRVQELSDHITKVVNVDPKELYDLCGLVKLLIADPMSMISNAGIQLAGVFCKACRRGFKQ